jgi:hypothetical protein
MRGSMKRFLAFLLAVGPTQAFAAEDTVSYFKDGNALLSDCESNDAFSAGACLGYVTGAHDGLGPRLVLVPENATAGQIKDVVVKYLRDNPESRNLPAGVLVMLALVKAWPRQAGAK